MVCKLDKPYGNRYDYCHTFINGMAVRMALYTRQGKNILKVVAKSKQLALVFGFQLI